MKVLRILGLISCFGWFGVAPMAAQCGGHHGHDCGDCGDCNHHSATCRESQSRGPAVATPTANVETIEGKVAEVVYLPGPTPNSGIVELRVRSGNQANLVRLAPSGFLKQNGLLVREGDAISVKGFHVAGMEGDLIVAIEIHAGQKSLICRDANGRPAW